MLFLNVHKIYRNLMGAHKIIISDAITPSEVKLLADDNIEETDDYSIEDKMEDELGVSFSDVVMNKENYVYTVDEELKTRPYINSRFFMFNDDIVGEEIIAEDEYDPIYRVPVGTKVLCKISIENPDNVDVIDEIDTIWVKDRLNLVDLPGSEILYDKEKGYVCFAFTSTKPGVANLKFKDNKFIARDNDDGDDFRFVAEAIESLDIEI